VSGFESEVLAARAFLAELEDILGQSLTECPVPPQKRQRLFANLRARSAAVSFPSLPNLLERSDAGCFDLSAEVDELLFLGGNLLVDVEVEVEVEVEVRLLLFLFEFDDEG
jgi:hypothetical protein